MNSHYFGIKRTYYGVLGRTRKGLSKAGLTSARYDVLTALWRWGEMLQRDIRHAMGVTRSTISRMLRALETLGLLVRARAEDRRNLVVRITPGGRRAIDSVSARDLWSEEGEQLAWASTSLPGLDGSWYDLLFSMDFVHYEAETNRMARVFGKAFGPYPPYHPDD